MRPSLFRLSLALAIALLVPLARPPGLASQEAAVPAVTYFSGLIVPETVAWAKSDDLDISMDDIGKVKRGKEHVKVHADVGKSGLVCKLKLKYPDGNADSPDDVVSNKSGICDIYFDVPDRESVVGFATAKLRVVTKGDDQEELGKASRTFVVRGKR